MKVWITGDYDAEYFLVFPRKPTSMRYYRDNTEPLQVWHRENSQICDLPVLVCRRRFAKLLRAAGLKAPKHRSADILKVELRLEKIDA